MKRFIFSLLCVFCMLPFFVSSASANEGYAVHSQQFLPSNIVALLSGDSSLFLLDHDPVDGNVSYVSWVSFDYLSEVSTRWGTTGVIVYNSTMKAYFIRVSFLPSVSETGDLEYCGLGTANGFLLGAKDGGFPSTSQDEYMQSYEKHWVKWSSSSSYNSLNIVSYEALCQIVLDLNSIQQPAGICRVSTNDDVYYVVMSTGPFTCPIVENGIGYIFSNTGWYYCSPDSATFAAKASTADALAFINQLCTQIHAKITSLLTACNAISSKLDTLTSVISDGKVLVDNSDVVSAIQSISFEPSLVMPSMTVTFEEIQALSNKVMNGTLEFTEEVPALTAITAGLLMMGNKLDSIDLNPTVDVVIEETEYSIDHLADIVINSDSTFYNVFYLTDDEGNETSVTRVAANSLSAAGKVLQFLFKFCLSDSLSDVDSSIGSLDSFYFDTADSGLSEGMSIWD